MLQIKIVGTGCPNCEKLAKMCQEVIAEEGIEAKIEKVTDVNQFAELGVLLTPGLIVNDKLLSSGKIPTKSTLTHWLLTAAQES